MGLVSETVTGRGAVKAFQFYSIAEKQKKEREREKRIQRLVAEIGCRDRDRVSYQRDDRRVK